MLLGDIGGVISGVSPKVNNSLISWENVVFEYIWYWKKGPLTLNTCMAVIGY